LIISIVGPESSGKTSLAEALALHFDAPWLPEYAREYLEGRPDYVEDDLEAIAREQVSREQGIMEENPELVILDTDLVVIAIWWAEVFGHVPDWVSHHLENQAPRSYLLVHPDLPWEPDPLRVSPHDRDRLFGLYQSFLRKEGFSVAEVSGQGEARVARALSALSEIRSRPAGK
jgi:nicotinamide riboside kinase